MAWRIEESVVRGEIDNRMKGVVRGRLWLEGIAEPVKLQLSGNAHRDLAGCLLTFKNSKTPVPMRGTEKATPHPLPSPPAPLPSDGRGWRRTLPVRGGEGGFALEQRGRIGDLTASRKVRVFDVPNAEAFAMMDRGEKPPEHMANCLYLEWFSEANGRVVIQSTDYELEISAPEWRLTKEDEAQRGRDAAAGWEGFVGKLDAALEQQKLGQKDPEEKWDEHDYERLMKESDARTDKYLELLENYGDSDEAEKQIAKEMGWDRELTPEEAEEESRRIEEINAACEAALDEPLPPPDPAREGIDWIRTEDGDIAHPLQHRCFESAMKVWHQCKDLGLSKAEDDDLAQFIFEFQTTAVKLGGALVGVAEGRSSRDGAFIVAALKRALDHLHKAQAGLEAVAKKKSAKTKRQRDAGGTPLPETLVAEARKELHEIREGVLKLMQEFREGN